MQRAASGLYHPSARQVTSRVVYSILILIILVGLMVGVYIWRQREVNQLREQTTQQSSDIAKLQGDIAALRSNSQSGQAAAPATTEARYASQKGVAVQVYVPAQHSTVTSPVAVLGEVPGNWSFEASFPIKLLDSKGKVVAQASAQLLGDWMTDQLVPFSAKLSYSPNGVLSGAGTLVLQKDNPSGLASNDDSVTVPVRL